MFENSQISILFYIIIVVVSAFVLFAAGGYFIWNYHLGKAMSPFFWLRIKGWTTQRVALFEIFSLTNSVSLEEARKETGDGYRLFIPSTVNMPVKKVGKIRTLLNYILAKNVKSTDSTYSVEKVKRTQNLIMPKSSYSINGVNTILLWDLHPQLHTDLLEGVKILIANKITTLRELEEFASDKDNAEQILFKNYSYRTFLDLYLSVKQKYYVNITTDDVANFIGKQFDKNFRESIEAKDFNMQQASKTDNKYLIYGYIAIILAIVIVGFKVIWQTVYG